MMNWVVELVGYVAALCLTVSSVPQLYETYKTKTIKGLSLFMLVLWFSGCFGMFWYVLFTARQIPLLVNYGFNCLVIAANIVLYIRYR